jgi:hypothetical protein
MDYEQKAAALDALADIKICFRKPGDWYVSQGVSIGGDGMLTTTYGNGDTPEGAILNHWDELVTYLPGDKYLVVDGNRPGERHFRWNGFMWASVAALTTEGADK